MHRHCDAQKRINRFEFFANKAERDVIEAGAAILFGDADAQQIQLSHLVKDRTLEVLFLVPLFDVRRNLSLRKLAHRLDQRLVIFSQLEIDHWNVSLELEVNNERTS